MSATSSSPCWYRLALLDDYQGIAHRYAPWDRLPNCSVEYVQRPLCDTTDLIATLQPFAIIGCMRERTAFPREVLQELKNLRLLLSSGARNAAIDTAAAEELSIRVVGTESPGHAASELAWAHIMNLAKRLHIEDQAMRRGLWQTGIGSDLRGQTLGILGLGRHGALLAGYGKAFGMRVIAWSKNLTAATCEQQGAILVSKEELFEQADFLSIHLKLSARSRSLVGREELGRMKPTAYLVNTSRAEIVDQDALYAALTEERIAGAGLDVFAQEPIHRDDPLLSLASVSLSPHTGYVTEQTYAVFYGQMYAAAECWLRNAQIE